jgi:hypothetical protein
MLDENLAIVANGTGISNVGSSSSLTFALVASGAEGNTLRRVAATANTSRKEYLIRHSQTGKNFAARTRTNLLYIFKKMDQDTSTTGLIIPSATVSVTIDRPTNMAGIITDNVIADMVGTHVGLLTTSGILTKLANLES